MMEKFLLLQRICGEFQRSGGRLMFADLLYKLAAFVLLAPLVSLGFRTAIGLYGRQYLTDVEIAKFFIHPLGLITLVGLISATIAILALEYATLFFLLADPHTTISEALGRSCSQGGRVLRFAFRVTTIGLAWLVPFLALAGLWFFLLLTKYDINFYLQQRPTEFWIAALLIGSTLLIPAAILVRLVVGWMIALPQLLLGELTPNEALQQSQQATSGHKRTLALYVVGWFAFHSLVGMVVTGVVAGGASWLLGRFGDSLFWALLIMVGTLVLTGVVQVLASAFATATFALLVWESFESLWPRRPEAERPVVVASRFLPKLADWQWFGIGLALCLVAGGLVWLLVDSVPLKDRAVVIAHRGYSSVAPENTLAAIQRAIDAKADFVEIDVQETSDGQIVVIHDRDLKKVANVGLVVSESTAEQLRQHDVGSHFSEDYRDERIPTLAEVLQRCRGKIKVNIELKTYGKDEILIDRVVELVESHQMVDQIVLMSLEADLVKRARAARPAWRVGQLVAVAAGDVTRIDADFLALNQKMVNTGLVNRSHRQDREVLAWTVNQPVDMSGMLTAGVDGLITDYPELARQVLQEREDLNLFERWLLALGARLEGILAAPATNDEAQAESDT